MKLSLEFRLYLFIKKSPLNQTFRSQFYKNLSFII